MANKLSESSKKTMITRIITGFVIIAVLIPFTILGSWFYFSLLLFILLVGAFELLNAPGKDKYSWPIKITTEVYTLLLFLSFFIKPWAKGLDPFSLDMTGISFSLEYLLLPILLIFSYFITLFMIAICSEKVKLEDVTYLFVIETFLALGVLSMAFIRFYPNATGTNSNPLYFTSIYQSAGVNQRYFSSILTLIVIVITWISDVGAYFVGSFFGKHCMNKRISPHKTWEGFFGGCFFSYIFYFSVLAILEYCFNIPLVPGLLQFKHSVLLAQNGVLSGVASPFLITLGLLLPFTGNLGGFLFSLIKRHYGIKDYGKVFPGHGGVIDRFDSIFSNSIFTAILLLFLSFSFNIVA